MTFASDSEKFAALEALLFIHGEPLSLRKIAGILDIEEAETVQLLSEFEQKLKEDARGLALLRDEEKVQLVTKPQFSPIVQTFMKEELSEDLTPASLETLAIVAYLGPIARSRIEYLRGVNSLFTLRNLRIRGLVERISDPVRPNAFLYRPTFTLMKHIGLTHKEDLPEYEKFSLLLKNLEQESAS